MVCDRSVVLQKDLFLLQMCNSAGGCMVGFGLQWNNLGRVVLLLAFRQGEHWHRQGQRERERSGRREIPANNTDARSSQSFSQQY
jgi:hypothetical protein